jgi:hypothetical protein
VILPQVAHMCVLEAPLEVAARLDL